MKVEVGLRFHLATPDGKVETLLVDSDRALIGTAAHCEVRLPLGEAGHEHVEVVAMSGVAYLSTRTGEAPPLLDGIPFVSGVWPPGATLVIGQTPIRVEVVDLASAKRKRSPLWTLGLVPLLATGALMVATRSAPAAGASIPPAPPLLDPVVVTCPSPPSATLPAYAAERARIGFAKRERSPFSPSDGVEAVELLETAAACYRLAGMASAADETSAAARSLRTRLEEEYRVRCVRVEHAFKVGDPVAAKREIDVLLPMMAHRRGPYLDWLGSLDRYASAALDARSTRRL